MAEPAKTMSGARAVVMIALCAVVASCTRRSRLQEPSPDGPTISDLEFVPGRTIEGCRMVVRFHFDSRGDGMPTGIKGWTLMRGRPGRDNAKDPMHPASFGSLGGKTSGVATIPVTFLDPGTYHYYVQAEDEVGRWSNVVDVGIVVDRRLRNYGSSCP